MRDLYQGAPVEEAPSLHCLVSHWSTKTWPVSLLFVPDHYHILEVLGYEDDGPREIFIKVHLWERPPVPTVLSLIGPCKLGLSLQVLHSRLSLVQENRRPCRWWGCYYWPSVSKYSDKKSDKTQSTRYIQTPVTVEMDDFILLRIMTLDFLQFEP